MLLSSDLAFADFLARAAARSLECERITWSTRYLADYLYDAETERLLPVAREAKGPCRQPPRDGYKFTAEQLRVADRWAARHAGPYLQREREPHHV
jgi:hypothetical protein